MTVPAGLAVPKGLGMERQLLIYNRVVQVNRDLHRDLSVRAVDNFGFARGVTHVPLLDAEFLKAGAEMPIVFADSPEGPLAVALLGSRKDDNDFLSAEGRWTGRYVPAFFRRYPFVFSQEEGSDRMTLCVDEAFEGLNSDGVGERLFDSTGQETQYTRNVLRFVEEYQVGFLRTRAIAKELAALDLLEPARIDFTLADGSAGVIDGFQRVSETRLRALPDAEVLRLFRAGVLDLITLHLASLQQSEALIARRSQA